MAVWSWGLLALIVAAQEPATSEKAQPYPSPLVDVRGLLASPAGEGSPVDVSIGFYALDFARVTSRDESFDLTGYLELSWHDPRLALPAAERDAARRRPWRRLDGSKLWTPRVFFENALEQPRPHAEPVIEVDPDGKVSSWSVVSGKFSTPMQLRRFPFDRQVLTVRIGSFEDETLMRFRVKNELVMVGDGAFLTDWTIRQPAARVDSHRYVPGQETYPRFLYQVEVERRSTFYVWRVMLPLTLLAIVPWAAFWFEPVGLQPQISTCMASLIALVAFNFAVDFALPKLVYLTLIDRHALLGFGFVVASIAVVTIIHLAVIRDRVPLARTIQRLARRVYMPGYAVAAYLNLAAAW
jgi:hypothetical protein